MRKYLTLPFILLIISLIPTQVLGQDDLLALLEEEEGDELEHINYTYGTFKGTKIVHSSSVDFQPRGDLQFSISHRFGPVNSGADRLWGLDDAQIRLGFEYGLSDTWAIGLGRSGQQATFDFYSKWKIVRQSSGLTNIPVSIVWNANLAINSRSLANPEFNQFENKLFYTHQLLIARKFNDRFSLQLAPTYTHNNIREFQQESNDTFYLGVASRWRFTKRMAILMDYYYIHDSDLKEVFDEPLGFGLELETGGHVFQIVASNTQGMTEKLFLARSFGSWANGDIRIGFNITRTFPLRH